ncbi:MAG: hypothetical protein RLY87_2713 [Chloroflexota bacterium]
MIIDIHQHYLPERPNIPNEPRQDWLYADSRVQGYRDVGALLTDMDDAGIDQVVWQGEYFRSGDHCRERNRRVEAARSIAPHRLGAFASIQPMSADAIDEIARARENGFMGVGELNVNAQGFSLRDKAVQRVFAQCERWALPVLLHVNEPVGPAYMGKVNNALLSAYELAARFPELRLIMAHWGGGLWWYEQIPEVQQILRNVWYDTAASFFTYPNTALMAQMAALVVPHKILFGSDYPLRPPSVPHGWLRQWTTIMDQACPEAYRSAWMGLNAAHLVAQQRPSPHPRLEGDVAPMLTAKTPLVVVAERWPDRLPILAQWGIHCDDHTPWWQTIAHALSESGHGPDELSRLMQALREGL